MPEEKVFKLAARSGITPHEISLLRDKDSWIVTTRTPDLKQPDKGTAMLLTAIAFVHRSIDMENNLGTKFYLACGTEYQLDLVFTARNFLIERGIINGQHTGKSRPRPKEPRKRKDRLPNVVLT